MLNTLRVDFKRYIMSKGFIIAALCVAVLQPLFTEMVVNGLAKTLNSKPEVAINNFANYGSLASIFLAIFVTMFLYAEVGEGIIRNKLISGKKRHEVLMSYCIVNSVLAIILQILSVFTVVITTICSGAEALVQIDEVVRYTLIAILAGISVSVLYTVSYLCFCTKKTAIAMPGIIAIFMKILQFIILDAIYTESGIPKVSGNTLKIYRFIDRFVAFFHLSPPLHHDNASYLIGNITLIIASIVVGCIVFSRKDLK